MSAKLDTLKSAVARGERVEEVREALGMSGEDFAEQITAGLRSYGAVARLTGSQLSQVEHGKRRLTVEEAAIIAEMDPEGRGIGWLVFGGAAQAKPERFRRRG